jgi:RNA polymerase II subunit A-like phosphatase
MSPTHFELWRLAEMFGAHCNTTITNETTHIISFRNDTDKVIQAIEAGIFVVKPEWLLACLKLWSKIPIKDYLLDRPPSRPLSDQDSINSDFEFDPAELQAMNDELAELEESFDEEDKEEEEEEEEEEEDKGEPSSKRLKSDRSHSVISSNDSFVEELERDLL